MSPSRPSREPDWTSSTSGIDTADPPLANEKVRQAIAGALDRASIVADDFPPGAEVATHYTPCEIPHGCAGGDWPDYDPTQAREVLTAAGLPNGFQTTIYYSSTPTPSTARPHPGRRPRSSPSC